MSNLKFCEEVFDCRKSDVFQFFSVHPEGQVRLAVLADSLVDGHEVLAGLQHHLL